MTQLPHHSDDRPREPASPAGQEPSDDRDASDAVLADEAAIDEAIEMTFPASDPPAWTSRRERTGDIEPNRA